MTPVSHEKSDFICICTFCNDCLLSSDHPDQISQQKDGEKMSQCLRLWGLPESVCNAEKKHCPIFHMRMCEFNFPPYREDRCCVKFFLGFVAQRLG